MKIIPNLWYDTQALDAARLYSSVLPDSSLLTTGILDDTPSGSVQMVSAKLCGVRIDFISAGPQFQFNPSISFMVSCDRASEVDRLWEALSPGGSALMELGAYDFSDRYGWTTDRYGLSWQIIHDTSLPGIITPTLMFVGAVCGRAEEAIGFYSSVFPDSEIQGMLRYGAGEQPDESGTVKHAQFTLSGAGFAAMDSALEYDFAFNEAVSFIVPCDTQDEIDFYWEKLSAEPEAEQCGWLKDRFGVSWQVVPTAMERMFRDGSKDEVARVTEAFLQMKKFDIAELERAYRG